MRKSTGLKVTAAVAIASVSMWTYTATADDPVVNVEQGWSAQQKNTWYTISQGSRLLPLAWFKALEQPDSSDAFLARSHTERFRYLVTPGTDPTPLPVGFAVDKQSDTAFSDTTKMRWKRGQSNLEPWVGMNCAACHTGQMTYNGRSYRIDGAPTLADFQGYMSSLNKALVATLNDPAKWDRFAGKVLAGADDADNRNLLKTALARTVVWQSRVEEVNAADVQYGFGRLDAFGHIYNKILLSTGASNQPSNPADAPVSYPFLWNIHQHDKVQWNGIAPNRPIGPIDIGALGRNVGEVIGVFADLKLLRFGPAIIGYPNSARVDNLLTIEAQLASLKPPVWPDTFPRIDAAKWEAGKALFENTCAGCHKVLPRNDLTTRFDAEMSSLFVTKAPNTKPLGTDPWMACNAYAYQAKSGALQGTPREFFYPAFGRPDHGATDDLSALLGTSTIGAIYYNKDQLIGYVAGLSESLLKDKLLKSDLYALRKELTMPALPMVGMMLSGGPAGTDKDARLRKCMSAKDNEFMAYKGRPLTGIWATAPYLHNGSVPTLYDLLLPPAQRPTWFSTGTREFDPERVGFVTPHTSAQYRTAAAQQDNTFVFRTELPGNSNVGHDYDNDKLTDADRWALVEYMKAAGGSNVGGVIVQ